MNAHTLMLKKVVSFVTVALLFKHLCIKLCSSKKLRCLYTALAR